MQKNNPTITNIYENDMLNYHDFWLPELWPKAKDKKTKEKVERKRDVESYKRHEGLARVGKSGRSEFIGSKGPKLVRTRAANAKKAITKCARVGNKIAKWWEMMKSVWSRWRKSSVNHQSILDSGWHPFRGCCKHHSPAHYCHPFLCFGETGRVASHSVIIFSFSAV